MKKTYFEKFKNILNLNNIYTYIIVLSYALCVSTFLNNLITIWHIYIVYMIFLFFIGFIFYYSSIYIFILFIIFFIIFWGESFLVNVTVIFINLTIAENYMFWIDLSITHIKLYFYNTVIFIKICRVCEVFNQLKQII